MIYLYVAMLTSSLLSTMMAASLSRPICAIFGTLLVVFWVLRLRSILRKKTT